MARRCGLLLGRKPEGGFKTCRDGWAVIVKNRHWPRGAKIGRCKAHYHYIQSYATSECWRGDGRCFWLEKPRHDQRGRKKAWTMGEPDGLTVKQRAQVKRDARRARNRRLGGSVDG